MEFVGSCEMFKQVKIITSSSVSIAEKDINIFLREARDANVEILDIQPIMSHSAASKTSVLVGAMIIYLCPVYDSAPIDSREKNT